MLSIIFRMLKQILEYTAVPMRAPELFGTFHIVVVSVGTIITVLFAWIMRHKKGKEQERLLFGIGVIFLFLELYKQLFSWLVLWDGQYDWWIFPFQLCSIPMYIGLLYPFLKKNGQQVSRTFLATYSLIGALCALAYPQDMLRSYVFLTAHAFLWHFLLLFLSLQVLFSKTAGKTWKDFARAVILFLGLAVCAMGINAYGDKHIQIPGSYPDMFYISLSHPTGQVFFRTVQELYGKPLEIVVYLGTLTAAAAAVYGIFCRRK